MSPLQKTGALCRVPVAGVARRAAVGAAGCASRCPPCSELKPCAGFLSPASRGALLTALLVVYLLLAVGAGFGSVWLWGMIQRSYEGWTGAAPPIIAFLFLFWGPPCRRPSLVDPLSEHPRKHAVSRQGSIAHWSAGILLATLLVEFQKSPLTSGKEIVVKGAREVNCLSALAPQ